MDVWWNNHLLYKDLVHHPIETMIYKWMALGFQAIHMSPFFGRNSCWWKSWYGSIYIIIPLFIGFYTSKRWLFGISEPSTASVYSLRPPDLRKTHPPHEVPNFDSARWFGHGEGPWSPHWHCHPCPTSRAFCSYPVCFAPWAVSLHNLPGWFVSFFVFSGDWKGDWKEDLENCGVRWPFKIKKTCFCKGRTLKWWVSPAKPMGFPTKNDHFAGVLGVPPFKETPILRESDEKKEVFPWWNFPKKLCTTAELSKFPKKSFFSTGMEVKNMSNLKHQTHLAGGWTNPFEKYALQNGNHLPQF